MVCVQIFFLDHASGIWRNGGGRGVGFSINWHFRRYGNGDLVWKWQSLGVGAFVKSFSNKLLLYYSFLSFSLFFWERKRNAFFGVSCFFKDFFLLNCLFSKFWFWFRWTGWLKAFFCVFFVKLIFFLKLCVLCVFVYIFFKKSNVFCFVF